MRVKRNIIHFQTDYLCKTCVNLILRFPLVDAYKFLPGHFSIGLLYFLVSMLKLIPSHLTAQFPLELVKTGIVMTRMNLVIQYLRFQLF